LLNALKLTKKSFKNIKVVANGAGAAGMAIIKMLENFGVSNIIMCDSQGAIYEGRQRRMNNVKEVVAKKTNSHTLKGSLVEVIEAADVFIGVSVGGELTTEMVKKMNKDPINFAMAKPDPKILPEDAKKAGAKIIGTGRSDFPNQVNNVLAFPGIFRGALDVWATRKNERMKMAAVEGIAGLIGEDELNEDYVIPGPFDPRVAPLVASSVAKAAMEAAVASSNVDPEEVSERTRKRVSGEQSK